MIRYFDNPSYFEKEIQRLKDEGYGITKTLYTDGKSTQFAVDTPRWEKELALMRSLTINKASYLGSFDMDTVADGNMMIITHSQTLKRIPVKYFELGYNNNSLKYITARSEDRTPLLNTTNYWRFVPDSGYVISGSQEIAGIKKNDYTVTALFRKFSQN